MQNGTGFQHAGGSWGSRASSRGYTASFMMSSGVAAVDHSEAAGKAVAQEIAKGGSLSVVRLLELLLAEAHHARASDIHLDPQAHGLSVRLRVDGILREAHRLPLGIHAEAVSRLKILSGLRTDERHAAQDGRFRAAFPDGGGADVRLSIVPAYHGERAVLRLLSEGAEEFTLESLGFSVENRTALLGAIEKPHGMILATGPTGSGKTTTLYTLLKLLNKPGVSILSIEDPVEYSIPGVGQIQVNPRTGLTFGSGLRSMLRQDPNVIMVGEIRDAETASLAVNTALTGHLVLSSLHTSDAPTTLPRLLDMKVEPYLVASTVALAVGQRLARRICTGCRRPKGIGRTELESLAPLMPGDAREAEFYEGAGCGACGGSGYRGRVGLHEVLEVTPAVREAIARRESAARLREAAGSRMTPLLSDGFRKAAAGLTTIEEVLRVRYE